MSENTEINIDAILKVTGSQHDWEPWRLQTQAGVYSGAQSLAPFSEIIREPVIKTLHSHPAALNRGDAAKILRNTGDKRVTSHLVQVVESDPDDWVRLCALMALHTIGDSAAVDDLVNILKRHVPAMSDLTRRHPSLQF